MMDFGGPAFSTARKTLSQAVFKPIQWTDGIAAMATALASYTKYAEKKGISVDWETKADKEGVMNAQLDVRRSQATSDPVFNASFVARGFSEDALGVTIAKFVHQFQNFPLYTGMTLFHETLCGAIHTKNYGRALTMLIGAFFSMMAAQGIEFGYDHIRQWMLSLAGKTPKNDIEPFWNEDDWTRNITSMAPGANLVGNFAISGRGDRTGIPVVDTIKSVGSSLREVVGDWKQGEMDQAAVNAALVTMTATGIATELPGGAFVADIIDRLFDDNRSL